MKKSTIFYSVAILTTWLVRTSIPTMDVIALEENSETQLIDRLVQSDSQHTLNIYTSSFDCLSVHNIKGNNPEEKINVAVSIPDSTFNKEASDIIFEIGNTNTHESGMSLMLGSGDKQYCFDAGDANSAAENKQDEIEDTSYYVYPTLQDAIGNTNGVLTYGGYSSIFIPDNSHQFVKISTSKFYDVSSTLTKISKLKLKGTTKLIFAFDTIHNALTKINIGEVGQIVDGVYSKVVGGNQYKLSDNSDSSLGASYILNSVENNIRLEVLKANEVKLKRLYTEAEGFNWADFYTEIKSDTSYADISAYNGISYYVDNTLMTDKEVFFNKFVREWVLASGGTREEWYLDAGYAKFFPEDGSEPFEQFANIVPAGFKGTIVVPFSNYGIPSWYANVDNGELDLGCVYKYLGFTCDNSRGEIDFIMKDVKLVKDAPDYRRFEQIPFWQGDVKVVLPMDYNGNSDLSGDFANPFALAANCDINCIDNTADTLGVSGKCMEITVKDTKNVVNYDVMTALEHLPSGEQGIIEGAKGYTMWLKNPNDTRLVFNFGIDLRIYEDDGVNYDVQRWQVGNHSRYYLFNTLTKEEALVSGYYNGIVIPGHFEGWVRVPFTELTNPAWEDISAPFDEHGIVNYMVFNYSSLDFEDLSFIVDSIGYYYKDVELTTLFNKPQNSFENAMKEAMN